MGSGLDWATIRESIDRVQYEWMSRGVTILWKDGT
jgi:hypothetical protein